MALDTNQMISPKLTTTWSEHERRTQYFSQIPAVHRFLSALLMILHDSFRPTKASTADATDTTAIIRHWHDSGKGDLLSGSVEESAG